MKPTSGQITRDPIEFAQEKNLRSLSPELTERFNTQNKQLTQKMGSFSNGAKEDYEAGKNA